MLYVSNNATIPEVKASSNGATPSSGTGTSVISGDKFAIGSFSATSNSLAGRIHEVLMYDTVLSDANREIVEGYLAVKWGLQSSLPASHPFKTILP